MKRNKAKIITNFPYGVVERNSVEFVVFPRSLFVRAARLRIHVRNRQGRGSRVSSVRRDFSSPPARNQFPDARCRPSISRSERYPIVFGRAEGTGVVPRALCLALQCARQSYIRRLRDASTASNSSIDSYLCALFGRAIVTVFKPEANRIS